MFVETLTRYNRHSRPFEVKIKGSKKGREHEERSTSGAGDHRVL